jgi:DivIVA domain-containing protein
MSGGPSDTLGLSTLTPDEVRATTFSQSPLAWRGYSEDEVRAFLNQMADQLAAADRERVGLRQEIDRLRNFYREHGHDVDLVSSAERRGRGGGGGGGGLVGRVAAYAEVQVERAIEYAELVDRRYEDQATAVFNHAEVQSALAVEDSIRLSTVVGPGYPALDPHELDRASLWLRAFYDALSGQLRATNDVLVRTAAPARAPARSPRH